MFKWMSPEHPDCAGPRRYVKTRRVDECRTMDEGRKVYFSEIEKMGRKG